MDSTNDPLRLFVESSVFIAASLSDRGAAHELLLSGFRGELTVLVTSLVLEETERNLYRKAPRGLGAFRELRQLLQEGHEEVPLDTVRAVAEFIELKDAPIVAGAMTLGASHLATFDRKHLLAFAPLIRQRFGIETVTPDVIVELLRRRYRPRRVPGSGPTP
jgi:predicted nucleic acid-binding protein